jgi:transposase
MTGVGLILSASSSGAQCQQGSLANAGNAQARRALVDGAWASRSPATGSRPRQLRLDTPPKGIPDTSWQAQVQRCNRDRRRGSRGQHPSGVTVAMARERAGGMGAMAKPVPVTPPSQDA